MSTSDQLNRPVFRNSLIRWLALLVTGLTCAFVINATFRLIYPWYTLFGSWSAYLYPVAGVLLGGELFRLVIRKFNRSFPWESGIIRRLALELLAGIFLSLMITTGFRWIWIMGFSVEVFIRFTNEIVIAFFGILVVTGMVLADVGLFLFRRWQYSLAQMEKFKKESAESRFETLRAQVNPHFLFNSLNTLSSLVYESQDQAQQFIRKLSDVYRYILDTRDKATVSFREENEFLQSYLFLLLLRHENKLFIEQDIPDEYGVRKIVPATLQLLIENAIKHNVLSANKPLTIRLFVDDREYLVVSNPLQPKEKKTPSSGFGLKNITSQYAFLTDRPVEVDANGSSFTVKIPLI